MAAIADISDLINRATGGASGTPQNQFFFKAARIAGAAATAPISGRPASLWRHDGNPSGGAAPTVVVAPTNALAGALPFISPGGGRESWLTQFFVTGLNAGTLILYDRLLHVGNLSGTVVSPTTQAVGGTLTRNTGGAGNFVFAEVYTIIGTSATTITMSYTNTADAGGRVSTAVAIGATGFREVTRAILLPLQSGDTGVKAVASITLAATTGTAGAFGITVGRPLAICSVPNIGLAGWTDFVTGLPGIPNIESGACLSLLWIPSTTGLPELFGAYGIVEA